MIQMEFQGISIEWLGHDSFKIKFGNKTIYIDPFQIASGEKADLVLITHEHYDHCSCEDIGKISSPASSIVCNNSTAPKIEGNVVCSKIIKMQNSEEIEVSGIKVKAVPAYNLKKPFHPKGSGIGYLIQIGGTTIYHAGDTDFIPEMNELKGKVSIALLPVSGTYVMTPEEAVKAAEAIQPELAIPMHYGSIIGSEKEAEQFVSLYSGKSAVLKRSD